MNDEQKVKYLPCTITLSSFPHGLEPCIQHYADCLWTRFLQMGCWHRAGESSCRYPVPQVSEQETHRVSNGRFGKEEVVMAKANESAGLRIWVMAWPSWTSTNQGLFCCHPVSYVAVILVQVEKQALHLPDTVSVKNIFTYFVCATLIFTTLTASFDFFHYWFTLSCSI